MVSRMLTRWMLFSAVVLLAFCPVASSKDRQRANLNTVMKQAASQFLQTLDGPLREQVSFAFDGPERTDWHFIPKDRVGVSLKEMNLEQQRAARELMRSVLSEKGYFKTTTIMSLESVLRTMEADRENVESVRDPEKYWFALFGDPSTDQPWGWRVEGHHLSLNFTSVDGQVVAAAPIFMGTNPAEVRVGPMRGLRVLGNEEDQARALMQSFSAEQQKQALIMPEPPRDVLTVPGKPVDLGTPAGVPAAEMTKPQRRKLQQMVNSFLHHLRWALANSEIRSIKDAGIEDIHFAWAGSLERGEKHYFRLHGPTFILEYDNAQGNHAHLVWHSRGNDFGADALQRHYQESPHHQAKQP